MKKTSKKSAPTSEKGPKKGLYAKGALYIVWLCQVSETTAHVSDPVLKKGWEEQKKFWGKTSDSFAHMCYDIALCTCTCLFVAVCWSV